MTYKLFTGPTAWTRLLPLYGRCSVCHGTQGPVAWENFGATSTPPCQRTFCTLQLLIYTNSQLIKKPNSLTVVHTDLQWIYSIKRYKYFMYLHHYYSDFHVWTFAYDVSGMSSVVFNYRKDMDGVNPLEDNSNEVYKSGISVQH